MLPSGHEDYAYAYATQEIEAEWKLEWKRCADLKHDGGDRTD
jgi:hypothetical protein